MAYNVALTIKANSPEVPIAILYNKNALDHLSESRHQVFDQMIELTDTSLWTINGQLNYAYPKLHLNAISPFEETIFLDVDTAWCGNNEIQSLFDQCSKYDFVIKNRNFFDMKSQLTNDGKPLWFWVNESEVAEAYKIRSGKMYSVHAEFIYFKKTDKSKLIFDTAIEVANDVKVESGLKWAGQNNCDEVPFSLSLLLNKVSIPVGFNPIHWYSADGEFMQRRDIMDNYSLISSGGNSFPKSLRSFYNDLIHCAAQQLNMPAGFPHQDKKTFLQERQSI